MRAFIEDPPTTLWIRIQHRFGPRVTEWFYAFHTMLFGFSLLAFNDVFNQPNWAGFASVMNQDQLGWIMMILGLLRIGGLIVNGARRNVTPWIRVTSATFGFFFFLAISYGFYLSGSPSTWIAIYPLFAIGELVNIHRASRDAGQSYALK